MRYKDSYFCFLNCHLAADTSQTLKRNQDYLEISRRLEFEIGSEYTSYQDYVSKNPWVCTLMDMRDTSIVNVDTGIKKSFNIFDCE